MAAKVILVGCGNMGHAMLSGWIAAGRLKPEDVAVVEPNDDLRARAAKFGAVVFEGAERIPSGFATELVIFATKPQVMRDVVPLYKRFAKAGATVLSIAAGTPVQFFEDQLGWRTPVIRCMPNTPAAIGRGMMVVFANQHVSEPARDFVETLLSSSGQVARIADEGLMDAVTAVSGSGPAYVFHFIECLTAAGVAAGLPDETAKLLAIQTVSGAAELASTSTDEPRRLREQVTSPNGTTAAALGVLMGEDRLKRLVTEAVEAARARSVELGK